MRVLVDAHALIWAVDQPARLSTPAATILSDPNNELLLSGGTIWEIAIKVGLGKLSLSLQFRDWMNQAIANLGKSILHVSVDHADAQAKLPYHHGDPFDRLLVAQALTEGILIVSSDVVFDTYGISRVW
jgi:PIN domain nuclease of toxin-antitoxin system